MNSDAQDAAYKAAQFIKLKSNVHINNHNRGERRPIGVVLGTGWGDALDMKVKAQIPLSKIPGFESLGNLSGHKRELLIGEINGRQIIALSGRVHLNEAASAPQIYAMVRLQVEMIFILGVRTIILTNAAGSLWREARFNPPLQVGDIAIIDGFVTLYAPDMPLFAGEFCSPEDTLSQQLINIALTAAFNMSGVKALKAGYAMVRGPQFEGRKYDKKILAASGAGVVGMSTLPEACIAALYGAEVLGLSFVTNDDEEEHSHKQNMARAQEASEKLGNYLSEIICAL